MSVDGGSRKHTGEDSTGISEVKALNSLPENFTTNQQRLEEAKTERYRALQKIRTLCETGRRSLVVPFLMVNLQRNPALKKIRLWQLDAIMYDG